MMNCKKIQKDLVAFLYGELPKKEQEFFQAHFEECARCRAEWEELKKISQAADALREDADKALSSVDWEALPSQIAENVFNKGSQSRRQTWLAKVSGFLVQPRLRPVYAALLIGIILGGLLTFVVFRAPQSGVIAEREFFAPQDFLEDVELEMARRETLDYLEKSRFLLLDFIQAPSEKSTDFWQSEFAAEQARDLLAKKRYINPQLDKFKLAKAKAICDQIEFLFYELTQISVQLSAEEVEKLQRMIEERQILLKINLLKKELEQHNDI
ncbi:MAG: zf-HC2 domain-containing protein [Candidatus Aminicenantes bacterium]|nr:zf-HC2 domain-containing protein [Candidatus Aminicenantes bacterium]MDH5704663.1 zf-HC2 domain-containing protein [Candidatus Aminicenantes bacterium]